MSVLIDSSKNYGINLDATACKDIEEIEQFIYLVPSGFKFLDGIVTQIEKQFIHDLAMVALKKHSVEVVARLLRNFQQLTYQLNALGFFKANIVDWPIPVFMEKNLLSNLVASKAELSKLLIDYSKQPKLHSKHAVGAFFLSLATESGLLVARPNFGLIRQFQGDILRLGDEYFIETNGLYEKSSLLKVRRQFIDPLSLAIFHKNSVEIKAALSSYTDDQLIGYLVDEMRSLVMALTGLSWSKTELKNQIASDHILRVPGYIVGRLTQQTPSYDVPLSVIARMSGRHIAPHSTSTLDLKLADEAEDNELFIDDGATKGTAKRERAVNANWVLTADFEDFITWLQRHPHLDQSKKATTTYLLKMAFYLGLRRFEAYGIRCCDVLLGKKRSTIRVREYEGNTLKSVNGKRNLAVSWLPKDFQQELIGRARQSRYTQKKLIDLFGGVEVAQTIFDICNTLLKEYFGDPNLTLHSLRHSFASRALLKLQASTLRLNELQIPDYIRCEIGDAESFSNSILGHQRPTSESLWHLSKIMGHADPKITLTSYLHNLDYLTQFSFASSRPTGYDTAVRNMLGKSNSQSRKDRRELEALVSGWTYPLGTPKTYLSPRKQLSNLRGCISSVTTQPISNSNVYRSPQWQQLCGMKEAIETLVCASPNEFSPEVLTVISKPMRSGVDSQVMRLFDGLNLNKLPNHLVGNFLKGFSSNNGYYSVPSSPDRAGLLSGLKASGLTVTVKDLSDGLNSPYKPYSRARRAINGDTSVMIKLSASLDGVGVSPQSILWLLCGNFVMTKLSKRIAT
jgi:integrase